MIGLGALLYLTIRLLIASYKMQHEEKRRQLQNKVEEQLVAMRAEALRRTSHEVRTPLSTITAISETLLDGSTGELTEDQREFIGDIDEAAKHLLDLVNDILDYAKAEAGMIRIAPQPVALVELVDQCVSMVDAASTRSGHHRDCPGRSVIERSDRRPATSTTNSAEPAQQRDQIQQSRWQRHRPHPPRRRSDFRISVRDTGRGISHQNISNTFSSPTTKLRLPIKASEPDWGLAIIKHLSELHGGTIEVESVVGTGTMFTVQLPREAQATEEEACESDEALARTQEFQLPNVELTAV